MIFRTTVLQATARTCLKLMTLEIKNLFQLFKKNQLTLNVS